MLSRIGAVQKLKKGQKWPEDEVVKRITGKLDYQPSKEKPVFQLQTVIQHVKVCYFILSTYLKLSFKIAMLH